MLRGVKFDNYHSFSDFSLILSEKEIEAPQPKIELIDVPGADGSIDLTDAFGGVRYNNRLLTFVFSTIVPKKDFLNVFSNVQNAIHGRRMKIILDDDPNFYYVGRVIVDKWKADRAVGSMTVQADCDPYKMKILKTRIQKTISGSETLIFDNSRKTVIPTITLTDDATILFNGQQYIVEAGTYENSDIIFSSGKNVMTVSGETEITVEYQEGEL